MNLGSVLFFLFFQVICTLLVCLSWHHKDLSLTGHSRSQNSKNRNASGYYLIAAYVLYIIIAVFRPIGEGYGGMDIPNYLNYYLRAKGSFADFSKVCSMEIGYKLLMWIFSNIGIPFRVFLFFIHSFVFITFAVFSGYCHKRSDGPVRFLCTFLLTCQLITAFSLIRNSIAISISMLFYIRLDKKQYWAALALTIAAVCFHLSAIILVAVYILVMVMEKSGITSKKPVFLWILAFIVAEFWAIPIITFIFKNTKYAFYLNNTGVSLGTYLVLVILTLAVVIDKKSQLVNSTAVRFLLIGWLCLPLQLFYGVFYRTVLYFLPVLYVTIPSVVRSLKKDLKITQRGHRVGIANNYRSVMYWVRILLLVAIVAYLLIRCVKAYSVDYVSYGIYPYFP